MMAETKPEEEFAPTNLKLYFSTVPGSHEIKKQQQHIEFVLEANKIKYEMIDVAASDRARIRMRSYADNDKALPPQIVKGHQYLGDYWDFTSALERHELMEFLQIKDRETPKL